MNKRYSIEEMAPVVEELVSANIKVNLTVTGNSMYPLFRSRLDTVVIEKNDQYNLGDIVFYKRKNGQYVLHRIVGIKDTFFEIAGDNETKKEFPVRKESIIGKVISAERGGKYIDFSKIWYKFYKIIWIRLFFLRKFLLKFTKTLAKLKNMMYNKLN